MVSFKKQLEPSHQLSLFSLPLEVPEIDRSKVTKPQPARKKANILRDRRMTARWRMQYGSTLVGPHAVAQIAPIHQVPNKLIAFSEAAECGQNSPDKEAWVHFYEDDHRFEDIWCRPEYYLKILKRFGGIIAPDNSVLPNMTEADKIENTRWNFFFGAWAQRQGLNVIANVRMCGPESAPFALAGAPQNSIISIGIHGGARDLEVRPITKEEVGIICATLRPAGIVAYGTDADAYDVLIYPREQGIPVYAFKADTWTRSKWRKVA